MMKIFLSFLISLFLFLLPIPTSKVFAKSSSFVSIVNPIRGNEFWDIKDQLPFDAVASQMEILNENNLSATWLIRFDALSDPKIIEVLKNNPSHEKGIFIEITPQLTSEAGVSYHVSKSWHSAGSVFLTGYFPSDREKIIDTIFAKFKQTFGFFPKSVGAWWVDAYSLSYMQQKYQIEASLIVADQYSTDSYQIWGQYWAAPYYPNKRNALIPAQTIEDKIPVVLTQWATRDPYNGYGKAVEESTFSVQANDYIDYHGLGTDYFNKLLEIYTNQPLNSFNQITIGLENSYSFRKYGEEYQAQIQSISKKQKENKIRVATMQQFALVYKQNFPTISPDQIIEAENPLGVGKVIWYMNPFYRVGLFSSQNGLIIRDLRQYVQGVEEPCLQKICDELNFATFAIRVLDDVTFGKNWNIAEGKIKDIKLAKASNQVDVTYTDSAGLKKQIKFLEKDISLNGQTVSIDTAILNATHQPLTKKDFGDDKFNIFPSIKESVKFFLGTFLFAIFYLIALYIPGLNIVRRLKDEKELNIFLSSVIGIVSFTIAVYITSFSRVWWLIFIYIFINLFAFIRNKYYLELKRVVIWSKPISLMIAVGTAFQLLPVFKSGLIFSYGVGLWGPNTHDGVWHLSLINQLMNGLPVENPIFSGFVLKNYHYLFDLLVAFTHLVSRVNVSDLLFRIYPLVFSLLLGLGTLSLLKALRETSTLTRMLSLFFVYFAGSFGWIIEYFRSHTFGGESNFWVNQSVSFNLNPPFAISLLIIIAVILLLNRVQRPSRLSNFVIAILSASLFGFKAYGAILVILTIFFIGLYKLTFKKEIKILQLFVMTAIFSSVILLPNFSIESIFIWSPFWFIHSMIDSPDRVGWFKLAAARQAYFARGEYLKFIYVESLSLLIFIFGNLGFRFFGLIYFRKNLNLFPILILIFFSMTIPLFFIQIGNPWNTIQFFYYSLFFLGVFSGIVLSKLFKILPKLIATIIIGIILFLTPINSWSTASGYLIGKPHAYLPTDEMEALNFLKSKPHGVVLSYPYDKDLKNKINEPYPLFIYDTTSYISAFSNKISFVSDEIQNEILQTDFMKRRVEAKEFFNQTALQNNSFLSSRNIKYLYIIKFYNINIDESKLNAQKIFENNQVIIYEFKG